MAMICKPEVIVSLVAFIICAASSADSIEGNATAAPIQWTHISSKTGGIQAPGSASEQTASLVLDVNNNGVNDIVIASRKKGPSVVWYRQGTAGWTKYTINTGPLPIEAGGASLDIDSDGDLNKPYTWDAPRLDVWLNNGTRNGKGKLSLDKWQRHVVDADKPWRSIFISSTDLNSDSKKDIVTGGWWYRNPGKPDDIWERQMIGSPLNNMAAVYDFDGDGDQDILGTQGKGSDADANFVWARNDGAGRFSLFSLNNIPAVEGDFLEGVAVAPFRNLGPVVVALSWHHSGYGVQILTVPSKPDRNTWTSRKLSRTSQDEQLSVGDIDRDGTLDLLLGTRWLCNACPQYPESARALDQTLGTGWLSWTAQSLAETPDDPDRNRLADVNDDGRLDAVVGFEAINVPGKLAWYEQSLSATDRWKEHVIANVVGPMSLDAVDMDGDSDIDVVVGEHNLQDPTSAKLIIFENVDGKGITWAPHLVYTGDEHHDGATTVDIDDDGDLDIISIGWGHGRVLLYENKAIDGPAQLRPSQSLVQMSPA